MTSPEKELLTALQNALLGTEQQKGEARAILIKHQMREGGEVGEPMDGVGVIDGIIVRFKQPNWTADDLGPECH